MTITVEALFARELREDVADLKDDSAPANLPSWDSFNNIRLIIAIEETYNVKLSSTDIEAMTSIRAVKEALRRYGAI